MPNKYHPVHTQRNVWTTSSDTPDKSHLVVTRRDGSTYIATVDTVDVPQLSHYVWRIQLGRDKRPTVCSGSDLKGTLTFMHRLLAKTRAGEECFFLNHDSLDYRKENLVNGTKQDITLNAERKCKRVRTRTGHRYITQLPSNGHYLAQAYRDGRMYYIGTYHSLDAAAMAQRLWYASEPTTKGTPISLKAKIGKLSNRVA